jgi:hypothetical protein
MESFIFLETALFLVQLGILIYYLYLCQKDKKDIEETPNKLTILINPTMPQLIGIFFWGLGLIFLLFPWVMTPIIQLNCSRNTQEIPFINLKQSVSSNLCELVEIDWFGSEKSKKVFSGLQGVKLETKTDADSEGKIYYRYQVLLLTDLGLIPFRSLNYSEYDSEEFQYVISSVKSFLANMNEKNLVFQEDNRQQGNIGVGISLFFDTLALLIIISGLSTTCTLDKDAHMITLSRSRRLEILGKTVIQYSLDEILDVKLESIDGDKGYLYRVVFVLSSENILPLTDVYSSGHQHKQQIIKVTKNFRQNINKDIQ